MDVKASKGSRFEETLEAELQELRAVGLYRSLRTVASAQGPSIIIDGKQYLNFSSNDYLGLANDSRLKEAAHAAIDKYGVGAGASRLICGNSEPYDELERALASFKRKDAALVFSSGYTANIGTICALVGENDIVIIDKLCHASIIDGCRQSGATLRVYPHKDMRKLESLLEGAGSPMWERLPRRDREPSESGGPSRRGSRSHIQEKTRRILIITETVYSMDGDLAPLPAIVELKEKYGAWLMIDEAHATGIFGANGRGVAEHFRVEDRVEITLGTLSKAIGCVGGYIAGSQTLIDYLRNKARSLIYSTALPPSICAASAAAVRWMETEEGRKRRESLWQNVRELNAALATSSSSPIIPIIIGDENEAMEVFSQLFGRGIFVPAIRYPTVAKGKARLRVTVTAAHTSEHIEQFAREVASVWNGVRSTDFSRNPPSGGDEPTKVGTTNALSK